MDWTRGLDCGLRFGLDFGLIRSSMTTISNTVLGLQWPSNCLPSMLLLSSDLCYFEQAECASSLPISSFRSFKIRHKHKLHSALQFLKHYTYQVMARRSQPCSYIESP